MNIEEIRAEVEAATPTVFEVLNELSKTTAVWSDTRYQMAIVMASTEIAHAREYIPALLDALEAKERENKALRNELCYKCGRYREAHNGACNGCKWRKEQNDG